MKTMKTSDLKTAISTVKPALSKSAIIEQTDHFIFDTKFLYGVNDKFCIRVPFVTENKFTVPGEEFFQVIFGISEEDLDFTIKDNQLDLKSGGTKAGIKIFDEIKVQDIIDSAFEYKKWAKLPEGFIDAISLCLFSASKDATRGMLNSIFIDKDCVVSSDDFRISKYKLPSSIKTTFLLPIISASELIHLSMDKISLNDSWALFEAQETATVFSSRVFNNDYPEVDKFFDVKGTNIEFPSTMKEIIDSVSYFAEGDIDLDKKVKISVDKDKIVCRGEKEKGWIEKTMPFKFKGKPFEFQTNPIFFSQMISKSLTVTIGKEAILFEMDNFKHVMSLPGE
jgi:DNA polymerase III sliding clamp (beta) subunit (PCNA family)